MKRQFRLLALAVMFIALVSATVAQRPTARVRPDGMLVVTLPPDLLTQRVVRTQLSSGLTTTFLVTASQDKQRGAARIEVRYEPWDELYCVTARGVDLSVQRARLASFEKLTEWWREAALPLLPRASPSSNSTIDVEVLPFSIEEQKETQRWLTRSLGEAQREQALDESEIQGNAGSASVLDVLIGTSIQRRPLVRHRWSVRVTR